MDCIGLKWIELNGLSWILMQPFLGFKTLRVFSWSRLEQQS
jgi:hypothetical protein